MLELELSIGSQTMPKAKRQERIAPVDEVPIRLRIESLEEGGYVATSPDVPGLVAEGRSIVEAVEIAQGQSGVMGARMTGGGFGGATVNLVRAERAEDFARDVARTYEGQRALKMEVIRTRAADGVQVWKAAASGAKR